MLAGRDAQRTSDVVSSLIQYIIRSWREQFARSVAMKFNCFFLLPFIDEFPSYLRSELDKVYGKAENGQFVDILDIAEARRNLMKDKLILKAECEANSKLQIKYFLYVNIISTFYSNIFFLDLTKFKNSYLLVNKLHC